MTARNVVNKSTYRHNEQRKFSEKSNVANGPVKIFAIDYTSNTGMRASFSFYKREGVWREDRQWITVF